MMQATLLFLLMKYLYIDESYDENVFVVGGVITNNKEEIARTYSKFKKHLKKYPLSENKKRLIMSEFKSCILDRSFPKIKRFILSYINDANINIIYSCNQINKKLEQDEKESLYITLLKNIINIINDDIVIVTFDSFSNTRFNSKIYNKIKEINNVMDVLCVNSFENKGLQFADNVVGTIRRHISGIDVNNDYEIISNKVISV